MSTQPSATLSEPQRQALQWLSRLSDRNCSDQDRQDFSVWLASMPEHALAYRQAQEFWEQIGGLPDMAGNRLTAARGYLSQTQTARRRRATALLVGAIAVGIGAGHLDGLQKLAATPYRTAKGEHIGIPLADGSRIELNTDSVLRVAEHFGARRVWLDRGEAWFDVKHDPERPFEVVLNQGRIRDVGTRFNVVTDGQEATVAVEDGEVALSPADASTVTLKAGQQSGFDRHNRARAVTDADAGSVGAWRNGVLIFKQQSLPEVLRQLSRYHRVEFELLDPKLQALSVSGRFSTSDLNENINTLINGLGVAVSRLTPERISIRAAK